MDSLKSIDMESLKSRVDMDSLKSRVDMDSLKSKARNIAASASDMASASAAAASEASSQARAAAIARLDRMKQESAAAAAAANEEKKFEDANIDTVAPDAFDPAILNAETNKLLSNQLVAMMEEHEQKEAQWKETAANLEARLEEQTKESERLLEEKDEALTKSSEAVSESEAQIESLKQTLNDTKAEKDSEHAKAIAALKDEIGALEIRVKAEEDKLVASHEAFSKEKSDLEDQIRHGAKERRKLHNTIQELRGNVRVFARVRPFLSGDDAGENEQPSVTPKADDVSLKLRLKGEEKKEYSFSFDRVFGPDTAQEDLFADVSEFVQSALDGYNVCLFSYGQTGSGKTHTMQGSGLGAMRGIIPRAIERVGEYKAELEAQGWRYTMKVSFLEIYNETIRDLLRGEEIGEKKHEIKVNPDGSRIVTDLTINPLEPTDTDAVNKVMETAAKYRTVSSTNMNDVSSRSHSIFTLHLTAVHSESNQQLKGMLNLCDLAGSERLKRSGVSGDQAKEAVSINKSLSALTNVFVSIGSKAAHVPYRNSKLTWLLQPSLSGDGKTLMLCNLSPTEMSSQESLSSLRFASQVNKCELGAAKRSIQDVGGGNGDGGKAPPRRSASGADVTSPGSKLTRPTSSSKTKTPSPSPKK